MSTTHVSCIERLAAPTEARLFANSVLNALVRTGRWAEFKILDAIVCPDMVHVMNDFVLAQHATKVLCHHDPVLQHVAVSSRHRMAVSDLDADVSGIVRNDAADPFRVAISRECPSVFGVTSTTAEMETIAAHQIGWTCHR